MATIKRCQTCRAPVDARLVWAIGGVCPKCLRPLAPPPARAAREGMPGLAASPPRGRRDDRQRPTSR